MLNHKYGGISKSSRTESINNNNNVHALTGNTKGYGGKTY